MMNCASYNSFSMLPLKSTGETIVFNYKNVTKKLLTESE